MSGLPGLSALPGKNGGKRSAGLPMWSVYLLTAMDHADVVPAGGRHRFDIDASGTHILSQRAFTKTCIALSIDAKAEA